MTLHRLAEHPVSALLNPFASRYTRPGCLPPLDHTGRRIDADDMLSAFDQIGAMASIRGPHGAGKSTLLNHLADRWEARGMPVERVRLRTRGDMSRVMACIDHASDAGLVCIDSWELAGGFARWRAIRKARSVGCRLLVTEHRRTGLPVLIECRTTVDLLGKIVSWLPDHHLWFGTLIKDADIEAAFALSGGNLREAIAELYDRFERRRPPAPSLLVGR